MRYRRNQQFRCAQGQCGGDIKRQVGAHGTAQNKRAVDRAVGMQARRQRRRTVGHDLHRLILIWAFTHLLQGAAGSARDLIGTHLAGEGCRTQYADIHHRWRRAHRLKDSAQIADLVRLGVGRADDQDAGLRSIGTHGSSPHMRTTTDCQGLARNVAAGV